MAKPAGGSTITLRKALALASTALGSTLLAKEQLREWLASGELPWDCAKWTALDTEGIARVKQDLERNPEMMLEPSGPYTKGDPSFFEIGNGVEIDSRSRATRRQRESGRFPDGGEQNAPRLWTFRLRV